MNQYNNLPLFSERARKDDPQGSHDRAATLDKSIKLTEQVMRVLGYISQFPGLSARDLGVIMAKEYEIPDMLEHPHKVASRLFKAGYITRKGSPFELTITEAGEKALREVAK